MNRLWQELRLGARSLGRSPGLTLVAVFMLALGIGVTSSVLIVIDAVILERLPYRDPERLVLLEGIRRQGAEIEDWMVSYLDFLDWRAQSRTLEDLAAHTPAHAFHLRTAGETEHVTGEMASAGYFRLLGIEPVAGRVFTAEEDRAPGSHRVTVLGHDFWRQRFGQDPGVLGREINLDGESYQVIGVMPPGFRGLTDEADLWIPLAMASTVLTRQHLEMREFSFLAAAARLRPGVTVEQAQREMDTLTGRLERDYPGTNRGVGVRLTSLREVWFGDLRPGLFTLLGGALLVLLIAQGNVANLLLVRAVGRQREMAIRAALGASRRRLVWQLLAESVLLALLGCVLGLLIAHWTTGLLVAASAFDFRSFLDFSLGGRVVALVAVLTLVSGAVFGLVPAWTVSQTRPGSVLSDGGKGSAGPGRRRFRSALVVAEVALALILSVGAGLLVQGFRALQDKDLGFQPENLLTLRLDMNGEAWQSMDARRLLARQLLDQVRSAPGVESVALVGPGMPTDDWYGVPFTFEDRYDVSEDGTLQLPRHHVSPGFFAHLGIPVLKGREFTDADTNPEAPVVLISEGVERRVWPGGGDPIGKRLKFGRLDGPATWFTIVGVVGAVEHGGIKGMEWLGPDIYFPFLQSPPRFNFVVNFLIRPAPGIAVESLTSTVRQRLRSVAPDLPVYDVRTMEDRLGGQLARDRFLLLLMGLFAWIALLLAAIGLYAVTSYDVRQSTREIGIRLALGAGRLQVLAAAAGRSIRLAVLGFLLGLGVALLLARLLRNFLEGLGEADPLTLAAVGLLLLVVVLGASTLAARRVLRIEPTETLRLE